MNEDLINFFLESATLLSTMNFTDIDQIFAKKEEEKLKCSQCSYTEKKEKKSSETNILKTLCCQFPLCRECTSKHFKQEGWFLHKKVFICPSCSYKLIVS